MTEPITEPLSEPFSEPFSESMSIDLTLENTLYETDEEYHAFFRRVFRFTPKDEEEEDEIADIFDEHNVKKGMDYIMEKTHADPWWNALYVKAASNFLSEDPSIGLCVLLTFTYLKEFYRLFQYQQTHDADDPSITVLQQELEDLYNSSM